MTLTDAEREHLERAETELHAALRAQRNDHEPDHSDFYAWGWLLTVLAEHADTAARLLAAQVADYGHGRTLRDDADLDPAERLERAVDCLDRAAAHAWMLRDTAAAYHSEIGHVGVEPPEST